MIVVENCWSWFDDDWSWWFMVQPNYSSWFMGAPICCVVVSWLFSWTNACSNTNGPKTVDYHDHEWQQLLVINCFWTIFGPKTVEEWLITKNFQQLLVPQATTIWWHKCWASWSKKWCHGGGAEAALASSVWPVTNGDQRAATTWGPPDELVDCGFFMVNGYSWMLFRNSWVIVELW